MHFQRQIEKLKKMILQLGGLVEQSVERAIRAVETNDVPLARQVIDGDEVIDAMEVDVEDECLSTLALHQPVALDLRFICSVLKINVDLERIGDLATNIAEQVHFLKLESAALTLPADIIVEAQKARTMVKNSLDALVNLDTEMAESVRVVDDEVDAIHRKMYREIESAIKKDPERVEALINVLNISRNLERIADHAVNVAEEVIYTVRGEITRHNRPHSLPKEQRKGWGLLRQSSDAGDA